MTGYIISASPNIVSTGKKQGRLLNLTIGVCGHPGRIVTGTRVCIANNFHKAIVTSQVTGCNIGKVISGDATHQLGFGGGGFSRDGLSRSFRGGTLKAEIHGCQHVLPLLICQTNKTGQIHPARER